MVKTGLDRKNKYGAKNDADALRIRSAAYKTIQDAKAGSAQEAIALIQQDVRDILDGLESPNAIAPIFSVAYQAVGMKLYGLSNRFGGAVFTAQAAIELARFAAMGLKVAALTAIAELFSITYP